MTDYPSRPERDCDILMKGGITSGVIYPRAVCELATQYGLRSVGGSSAGAIAAAAAAAAESNPSRQDGFERLERLPADITAKLPDGTAVLGGLFQPQRSTRPLYKAFTAGLGRSGPRRVVAIVWGALIGFFWWALAGAIPGAVLLVLGIIGEGLARWAAVIAAVVLLMTGAVAGIACGVLRSVSARLPANGFGLCSGMPGTGSGSPAALTPWLHSVLLELAGRESVLTFANLDAADVKLRMMTTNLTRRQPMRMPWFGREYFFCPDEFRALFPADVVDWMENHAPPLPEPTSARAWRSHLLREQAKPRLPFPSPPDLPVVVATRMSLSFPVLIAAVPLYAVDFTLQQNQDAVTAAAEWRREHPNASPAEAAAALKGPEFEVNWFSDGGIASNLPVHFFDTPLPTRPTFAIDLAPFPDGVDKDDDESKNSGLPGANQAGRHRRWSRWNRTGLGAMLAFGRSIVDTARSWVDQSQLIMPGYRDRIVTIYHDKAEGGMNLNMDEQTVDRLVERGQGGAAKLVDSFVYGDGWLNHRWIRFRTATAGLDRWLAGFRSGYETPGSGYPDLAGVDAAGNQADGPVPSYPMTDGRRVAVNLRTAALVKLTKQWSDPPTDAFTHKSPRPSPALRLVPSDILDRARRPAAPDADGEEPIEPPSDSEPVDGTPPN
ncbi:patatin-like phospholipase family protein [Kribbella jiaozuonensis]|uniref:SuhR protein n=1 Tax=Kribbella jiaozuonensis TaxID=2575441 RepID=A0A4U3M5X7_9ACTN|nr:patatin-like phospholipase family protein [Kribbella jiaozuonensis]TKK82816.1 SuhR protein [Kribbella jiaozuonensis]